MVTEAALRFRCKQRKTVLCGIFKYLHDRNYNDTDKIFKTPDKKVIQGELETLTVRLRNENISPENSEDIMKTNATQTAVIVLMVMIIECLSLQVALKWKRHRAKVLNKDYKMH